MYQKTANFDEWKLIFGRKFCDFYFVEYTVFPNVSFLSTSEIIERFSVNISQFFVGSVQRIRNTMSLIKLQLCFFTSFCKKSKNLPFELMFELPRHFSAWALLYGKLKLHPTTMKFDIYQDSFEFILLAQSLPWYLNWIRFRVDLVSRTLGILNFAWIY